MITEEFLEKIDLANSILNSDEDNIFFDFDCEKHSVETLMDLVGINAETIKNKCIDFLNEKVAGIKVGEEYSYSVLEQILDIENASNYGKGIIGESIIQMSLLGKSTIFVLIGVRGEQTIWKCIYNELN